jgi:hypothetical protein
MMERNFYNDEFEELIREKTDQYKMYPSENVWRGVHGSLHTKRRWFIGSMSALIIGIIFFAGKELILQGNHSTPLKKIAGIAPISAKPVEDKEDKENNLSAALSDFKTSSSRSQRTAAQGARRPGDKAFLSTSGTEDGFTDPASTVKTVDEVANGHTPFLTPENVHPDIQPVQPADLTTTANGQTGSSGNNTQTDLSAGPQTGLPTSRTHTDRQDGRNSVADIGLTGSSQIAAAKKRTSAGKSSRLFTGVYPFTYDRGITGDESSEEILSRLGLPPLPASRAKMLAISIDRKQIEKGVPIPPAPAIDVVETGRNEYNWLEEYAINQLIPAPKRRSRYSLQLYITPSFNYRSLTTGGSYNPKTNMLNNNPPVPAQNGSVSDLLNERPSPGFEAGGSLLYRFSRNLTLKAGLQFNYIRYTLTTPSAASSQIASNASNPNNAFGADSASANTGVHNQGGKTPAILTNQYYQLSAPVGFEFRILGGERLQLNIAATLQPTYLLNPNSYAMSSDYTGYTKDPSLFRKWNLNGAVEAFLSYKVGGLRWQIGPEFRYQIFSTYISQYPIRENFRQYGLKIGVSRTIW